MSEQITVKLYIIEFETNQHHVGFVLHSPWIKWVGSGDEYDSGVYLATNCPTNVNLELRFIQGCLINEVLRFDCSPLTHNCEPSDDELKKFEKSHIGVITGRIHSWFLNMGLSSVNIVCVTSAKWIERTFQTA